MSMIQKHTLAERIKEYRTMERLSLAELSEKTGIPPQTLNRYELGQRVPKVDAAAEMAERLHINPLWLQGYDVPMAQHGDTYTLDDFIPYKRGRRLPILGSIPAGSPVLAAENIEGYEYADVPEGEDYFFLRVKGDSMINARIQDGDLVLIKMQPCADNGQIVACIVNGDEGTLKRFNQQGDMVVLMPENPTYRPIILPCKDFETNHARILGVAKEVIHRL